MVGGLLCRDATIAPRRTLLTILIESWQEQCRVLLADQTKHQGSEEMTNQRRMLHSCATGGLDGMDGSLEKITGSFWNFPQMAEPLPPPCWEEKSQIMPHFFCRCT